MASPGLKRLLKVAISSVFFFFDFLADCFLSSIKARRARSVVLYYHCVRPEERSKFAQQMDDLLRLTKPVTFDEPEPLAKSIRHSAVTFDDGFTCVIENALPELIKRNIPATVFVPSGQMGKKPSWSGYKNLKTHQETVITAKQIKDITKSNLITIGSHGVTHSNLLLIDQETAKLEIANSKKDLESILGSKVKLLSFPYGGYNAGHTEMARESGYEKVFTVEPKCDESEMKDFVVGRVRVDPFDWRLEYRLKLLGAYRWLPMVSLIKQKIRSFQ